MAEVEERRGSDTQVEKKLSQKTLARLVAKDAKEVFLFGVQC
jgi:hypothetical protein